MSKVEKNKRGLITDQENYSSTNQERRKETNTNYTENTGIHGYTKIRLVVSLITSIHRQLLHHSIKLSTVPIMQ